MVADVTGVRGDNGIDARWSSVKRGASDFDQAELSGSSGSGPRCVDGVELLYQLVRWRASSGRLVMALEGDHSGN